jgi:hypothetical protein
VFLKNLTQWEMLPIAVVEKVNDNNQIILIFKLTVSSIGIRILFLHIET